MSEDIKSWEALVRDREYSLNVMVESREGLI